MITLKSLRLALAKWALAPNDITAEDLTKVLSQDFTKILSDSIQAGIKQLQADALAGLIWQNNKIADKQKVQLIAILAAPENNNSTYLG